MVCKVSTIVSKVSTGVYKVSTIVFEVSTVESNGSSVMFEVSTVVSEINTVISEVSTVVSTSVVTCSRALNLSRDAVTLDLAGVFYFNTQRTHTALQLFSEATRKDPSKPELLLHHVCGNLFSV